MSQKTEIEIIDETTHGAYRAKVDGPDGSEAEPVWAELTWTALGEARIAEHTFTPPEARGKGIAMALVEQMVADAREQGFTIVPECTYVAAAFRRHPEWADILAEVES